MKCTKFYLHSKNRQRLKEGEGVRIEDDGGGGDDDGWSTFRANDHSNEDQNYDHHCGRVTKYKSDACAI